MGTICLQNQSRLQAVAIPGSFIENYMAQANGEFVKVYLCLLYRLSLGQDLDCSQLADTLMCTEGDILRALRYWDQLGLIHLAFRDGEQEGAMAGLGSIESVSLCDPCDDPLQAPADLPAAVSDAGRSAAGSVIAPALPGSPSSSSRVTPIRSAHKSVMTPDRIAQLSESEEIKQLLFIAEQYMGRPLTSGEMQRILLFYDDLHMSIDLIDYLIEYCVSHGHTSIHYIETVAHAWAREGITTVSMAKQTTSVCRREFFTVLRALGISGRNPVSQEIRYMETWFDTYGFSLDIVLEACSRTVISTGKGTFQYADSILSGWHKKKVCTLEDIRKLDEAHVRKAASRKAKTAQPAGSSNRFNNFTQRNYDFDELERMLMN